MILEAGKSIFDKVAGKVGIVTYTLGNRVNLRRGEQTWWSDREHLTEVPCFQSDERAFDRYRPFIEHLLANHKHVHIHATCPRLKKDDLLAKHLTVTGQDLDEDKVFWNDVFPGMENSTGTLRWCAPSLKVTFPWHGEKLDFPGKVTPSQTPSIHSVANNDFVWYLLKYHGFQIKQPRLETFA